MLFRAPKPAAVQTAVASAQDIYNSITVQGIVEAADSVAVCPYENAVITAVYAAVGDSVEAGDILCSLVPREGKELEASSLQSVWKIFFRIIRSDGGRGGAGCDTGACFRDGSYASDGE